jgi:hypothetical protein
MIRIPFCEGSGECWTNYYGWVPRSLWDVGIRQVGLLAHSVRLLDTVFDRNGQLAISSNDKRKVAPRKKCGK